MTLTRKEFLLHLGRSVLGVGLVVACNIEKLPSELKREREKKKQKELEELGQPGRPELSKQTYDLKYSHKDLELVKKPGLVKGLRLMKG